MTSTASRLENAMQAGGYDQSRLARELNVSQGTISKIVLGKTANSRLMPRIAVKLGVPLEWLLGMSDDRGEAAPPVGNDDADDDVEIAALDLAYGMGGSFLDTDDGDIERAKFSRSWLRQFTPTSPEMLFSAQGIGDSMWPTIHDRDVVIADRSSRTIDQADKIWAIVFGGVGMIKRLRPLPDGTVRIMSDNPQVSDELATDGDLFIVGRVAAIVRRV